MELLASHLKISNVWGVTSCNPAISFTEGAVTSDVCTYHQREAGWLCGTGCLRIRFGNAPVDPEYISYYLRQETIIDLILSMAVGTTMPNLNSSILESVPISLPPLPIQRRIAEILGRLDDKIEVNRRINATLEAMAQKLYRHWFVEFGPFRDGEFVESELGAIPKGWEVRSSASWLPYQWAFLQERGTQGINGRLGHL